MPTEDIYTSRMTLSATIVHQPVCSARNPNKSYYYYSRRVRCTVAKSNAAVGYQFTFLVLGKALLRADGFFRLCSVPPDQEPDMARNSWLVESDVGMFGGIS